MTKIDHPAAVREAAANLKAAVDAATAAGYQVAWPSRPGGLDNVSISETKRVQPPAAPAAKKAPPAKAAEAVKA